MVEQTAVVIAEEDKGREDEDVEFQVEGTGILDNQDALSG